MSQKETYEDIIIDSNSTPVPTDTELDESYLEEIWGENPNSDIEMTSVSDSKSVGCSSSQATSHCSSSQATSHGTDANTSWESSEQKSADDSSRVTQAETTSGDEFYVDWDNACCGIKKTSQKTKDVTLISKGCFAIKIVGMVEAGSLTGFQAEVVRKFGDKKQSLCYFTSDSIMYKPKFMSQLNATFGSGGMSCSFNDSQLTTFIHFVLQQSALIPVKKAALVIGRQPDSDVWVINPTTQIDAKGAIIPVESSQHVWLDHSHLDDKYSKCKVPKEDICTAIAALPTKESEQELLSDFLNLLEACLKHNFTSALLMIGASVMVFHFTSMCNKYGGCSIPVAIGEPETGKSTAIKAALSLTGSQDSGYYVKGTNAFFLDRASVSTLPFGIDDPHVGKSGGTNRLDLPELTVDIYNSAKSANAVSGSKKPISAPLIASNRILFSEQRYQSRVLLIPFNLPSVGPTCSEDQAAYEQLASSFKSNAYSALIGWVIRQEMEMTDDQSGVDAVQDKIREAFGSNFRALNGWKIALYFTIKLLEAAGMDQTLVNKTVDFVRNKVAATYSSSASKISHNTSSRVTLPEDNPERVVNDTLKDLMRIGSRLSLSHRLNFMRTGTKVNSRDSLVFHLNGIECHPEVAKMNQFLTHNVPAINKALQQRPDLGVSVGSLSRGMLRSGVESSIITSENSCKQQIATFYLGKMGDMKSYFVDLTTKKSPPIIGIQDEIPKAVTHDGTTTNSKSTDQSRQTASKSMETTGHVSFKSIDQGQTDPKSTAMETTVIHKPHNQSQGEQADPDPEPIDVETTTTSEPGQDQSQGLQTVYKTTATSKSVDQAQIDHKSITMETSSTHY